MGEATRLIQPRIVLDTNVLVSTLLFGGRSLAWLVEAWQFRRTTPLASAQTATELIRVLGYPKFRLSEPERERVLGEYLTVRLTSPTAAIPTTACSSSWPSQQVPMPS